jgi:hypothetical protein
MLGMEVDTCSHKRAGNLNELRGWAPGSCYSKCCQTGRNFRILPVILMEHHPLCKIKGCTWKPCGMANSLGNARPLTTSYYKD